MKIFVSLNAIYAAGLILGVLATKGEIPWWVLIICCVVVGLGMAFIDRSLSK